MIDGQRDIYNLRVIFTKLAQNSVTVVEQCPHIGALHDGTPEQRGKAQCCLIAMYLRLTS